MIIRVTLLDVCCDKCGTFYSELSEILFNNKKEVCKTIADEQWLKVGAMHFCDECVEKAQKENIDIKSMSYKTRKEFILFQWNGRKDAI